MLRLLRYRSALPLLLSFLLGLTVCSLLLNAALLLLRCAAPPTPALVVRGVLVRPDEDEQLTNDDALLDKAHVPSAAVALDGLHGYSRRQRSVLVEEWPADADAPEPLPPISHRREDRRMARHTPEARSPPAASETRARQGPRAEINAGHSPARTNSSSSSGSIPRPIGLHRPASAPRVFTLPPIVRSPPKDQDCPALIAGDRPLATLQATYSTYRGVLLGAADRFLEIL